MTHLAKNTKVDTSNIHIDPTAKPTRRRLEVGDLIRIHRDGQSNGQHEIIRLRPLASGNIQAVLNTGGRINLTPDATRAVQACVTVEHVPTQAPVTKRGWSRYSRPQGTCQYCGAPCADTPSPTCDNC